MILAPILNFTLGMKVVDTRDDSHLIVSNSRQPHTVVEITMRKTILGENYQCIGICPDEYLKEYVNSKGEKDVHVETYTAENFMKYFEEIEEE